MYAAWKGAGGTEDPANYRSLFVSSVLAKAYNKLIQQADEGERPDGATGNPPRAPPRAPIAFASMYLAAFFRGCHRLGHSYAVLFIDTKAAYYRVARQVATGPLERDEDVARLLAQFGLQLEGMHHLLEIVRQGGLMGEANMKPVVREACADFHRHTWFVSHCSSGDRVAVTQAGSRPGESWADAVFAFVARVLGTLAERLDGEGILSYAPVRGEAGPFPDGEVTSEELARDGTWADDSAIPVEDRDPVRLVSKAKRLCSVAISTLEEFGLCPNLKRGKTTVMLHLTGRGVQRARKEASYKGKAVLYLPDLDVEMPVALQYTHLCTAV